MIEILCRFDARDQAPVVFLADSINDKQIQVWRDGAKPVYVPLDYYKMTAPLSAADERVLMERFKDATGKKDQVVNIRHRLPRTSRPLPNMLATEQNQSAPAATEHKVSERRKPAALRIEAQKAPAAPQGAPEPGDGLTPVTPLASLLSAPVLPSADGLQSTALWAKIEQLNARIQMLGGTVADLTAQLQDAITDLDTAKAACQQLIGDYNKAIDDEAAEILRKRQEMLTQLSSALAPTVNHVPVSAPDAAPAVVVAQQAKAPAPVVTVKKQRKVADKKVSAVKAKAAPKAAKETPPAPAPVPSTDAAPAQ